MNQVKVSKTGWRFCVTLLLNVPLVCGAGSVLDGKKLQAKLDAGKNIALQPGQVIELRESLKFRKAGQRIETVGAAMASEYARIVLADGAQGTLIEANGIAGATLAKLILDGNRPGFQHPEGILPHEPMLSFGGEGAVGQEVRNCIVMDSRSAGGWGAIHVQEGGKDIAIRDNLVFASGADIRGNGRSPYEKPFGWGDGISTASRDTLIENNLIVDATDEGIMVQGGPGTVVKENVIVALSREMLGGIALIDPFEYYALDVEKKTFDYRGVVVEDNLILAAGARIHAGLPMGGAPWNSRFSGTVLAGARVLNNHISGDAAGYGYVVNGVDGFEIKGNTCDATCSGPGDGVPGKPPDAPIPFMYDPGNIGNSRLQKEFVPMTNSLTGVLRASRTPKDSRDALGYRDAPYPEEEARAVVRMAFIEMLGRDPQEQELKYWSKWLQQTLSNGDTLRRNLMANGNFVRRHGYVNPLDLHRWRNQRWLEIILKTCSEHQAKGAGWPNAREWNDVLLGKLLETQDRMYDHKDAKTQGLKK